MRAIGPYEVVRELGRGGMGAVYEGLDRQLDRRVALKVVLEVAADPDALVRFEREAQLLARVHHPGIVRVHALERAGRSPVLVTELIEGARPLEPGPLPPREAARIVRELADAVEAVHQAGVLHRDLKPSNVLRRADGSLVLLDFGVARELDGSSLTRSGDVVGTPAFMAPEQVEGRRDLDARADVYGLGALLYQLLVGRAPFSGGVVQVLAAVLDRDPAWPADVTSTPASLDRLVRRAMAKRREDRPPSAAALRDELEAWLAAPADERVGLRRLAVAGAAALVVVSGALAALVSRGGDTPAGMSPPIEVGTSSSTTTPTTTTQSGEHGIASAGRDELAEVLAAAQAGALGDLRNQPWLDEAVPRPYLGRRKAVRVAFLDSRRIAVAVVEGTRAAVATITSAKQLRWTPLPEVTEAGLLRRVLPAAGGMAMAGSAGLALLDAEGSLARVLHGTSVVELAIADLAPGRARLLFLDEEEGVKVVDTDGGEPRLVTPLRRGRHRDVELALSPDGSIALVLAIDGQAPFEESRLMAYRLPGAAELPISPPRGDPHALSMAFLSARSVVLGREALGIARWSVDSGSFDASPELTSALGYRPGLTCVAASPGRRTLYGTTGEGMSRRKASNELIAWTPESGSEPRKALRDVRARSLAVSPDGLFLAIGTDDDRVEVWIAADDLR